MDLMSGFIPVGNGKAAGEKNDKGRREVVLKKISEAKLSNRSKFINERANFS